PSAWISAARSAGRCGGRCNSSVHSTVSSDSYITNPGLVGWNSAGSLLRSRLRRSSRWRFRFRRRFVLLLLARACAQRDAGGQAMVLGRSRGNDHETRLRYYILPDVLAVVAAAHLDDCHDLAELAVYFDVAQADDVVGKKRNRVVTE